MALNQAETFEWLRNRVQELEAELESTAASERETAEEELDKELRRWQDGIRDHVITVSGAFDGDIDGAGCDSGDPLDFSLAEISQGFNHVFDEHEAGRERIVEIIKSMIDSEHTIRDLLAAIAADQREAGEPSTVRSLVDEGEK